MLQGTAVVIGERTADCSVLQTISCIQQNILETYKLKISSIDQLFSRLFFIAAMEKTPLLELLKIFFTLIQPAFSKNSASMINILLHLLKQIHVSIYPFHIPCTLAFT